MPPGPDTGHWLGGEVGRSEGPWQPDTLLSVEKINQQMSSLWIVSLPRKEARHQNPSQIPLSLPQPRLFSLQHTV